MEREDIQAILDKAGKTELTELEQEKLRLWLFQLNENQETGLSDQDIESAGAEIWSRLKSEEHLKPARKLWPKIAIAAAVASVIFGAGLFMYKSNQKENIEPTVYASDVAPGRQGATLKLSNGKTIRLADAANGQLAKEAGVVISKTADGQIVYEIQSSTSENKINTISTANGETYVLRLPDGSRVWLNAASELTYSANLVQNGRRSVKLSGEGYFEVAKDAAHPFVVESSGQSVEVLGTHFNVNSYLDEKGVATTLVEGSIKVNTASGEKVIRPGEQALSNGNAIKVSAVNLDNITDWKDGDFNLDGLDFRVAMRKIARWYNVELIYDDAMPKSIQADGWISRDQKLSAVLDMIEKTGIVHFKIAGNKVYVTK